MMSVLEPICAAAMEGSAATKINARATRANRVNDICFGKELTKVGSVFGFVLS
jgi:hypothetical protein